MVCKVTQTKAEANTVVTPAVLMGVCPPQILPHPNLSEHGGLAQWGCGDPAGCA